MSIVNLIAEFATKLAEEKCEVDEIRLDASTFEKFKFEAMVATPVDPHEADYDRPGSPWYGSRPAEGSVAYFVYSPTRSVAVKGPRRR